MPPPYAHTHPDSPEDSSRWEPLFTTDCESLRDEPCDKYDRLDPNHGHLNKVAHLAGKFAREMFTPGSEDAETAAQWGHLPGHYPAAQQFTVQVYEGEWEHLKSKLSFHCDEAFAILDHYQNDYHPENGLKRTGDPDDVNSFYL